MLCTFYSLWHTTTTTKKWREPISNGEKSHPQNWKGTTAAQRREERGEGAILYVVIEYSREAGCATRFGHYSVSPTQTHDCRFVKRGAKNEFGAARGRTALGLLTVSFRDNRGRKTGISCQTSLRLNTTRPQKHLLRNARDEELDFLLFCWLTVRPGLAIYYRNKRS